MDAPTLPQPMIAAFLWLIFMKHPPLGPAGLAPSPPPLYTVPEYPAGYPPEKRLRQSYKET